jgi:hypothetical protein
MACFIVISSGVQRSREPEGSVKQNLPQQISPFHCVPVEMTTILIIGIMEDNVIKTTLTQMIFNSISQKNKQ